MFYLLPRDFDPDDPNSYAAWISAAVDIVWAIIAEAFNLNFAALYNGFDEDASESVMDILEESLIPRVQFEFEYREKGFDLSLTGSFRISSFKLSIGYWYDWADKSWTFQGQLGFISDKDKATIATIVRDFDTKISGALKEIVFSMSIAVPAINKDATDFDSAPVQLSICH